MSAKLDYFILPLPPFCADVLLIWKLTFMLVSERWSMECMDWVWSALSQDWNVSINLRSRKSFGSFHRFCRREWSVASSGGWLTDWLTVHPFVFVGLKPFPMFPSTVERNSKIPLLLAKKKRHPKVRHSSQLSSLCCSKFWFILFCQDNFQISVKKLADIGVVINQFLLFWTNTILI